MNTNEFINKIENPVILVKDEQIVDWNKNFEDLGEFDKTKTIYDLFYFPTHIRNIKEKIGNKRELICLYNYDFFEFIISPATCKEFDYFVLLKKISRSVNFDDLTDNTKLLHLGYIIIYFDIDKNITDIEISKNIIERFDLTQERISFDDFIKLFRKNDYELILEKTRQIIGNKNKKIEFVFTPIVKNAGQFNLFLRGFYSDADGISKIIFSTIDFTEINSVVTKLLSTELGFRALFYNNFDPVLILNRNRKILLYNTAAKNKAEELSIELQTGLEISKILTKECFDSIKINFKEVTRYETTIEFTNNIEAYLEITTLPIKYYDQQCVVAIIKDQTSYKSLLNQIIENETKFKEVLNSAYDGIVLVNQKGIVEFWNKAAEKIFEYTSEEIVNKPLLVIFKNPDNIKNFEKNVTDFFSNKLTDIERHSPYIKSYTKSNKEFLAEIKLSHFKNGGNEKIIAILRDVTNAVKNEIDLKNKNESIEEVNSALKKFISILSHDLRTPLVQVISLTELIDENLSSYTEEEIKEYIKLLNHSAKNGISLLENLLLWGRAISNNVVFEPILFSIQKIIEQSISLYQPIASNKAINIICTKQDFEVFADSNMVLTIINNLLSNAIKFSHRNSFISIKIDKKEKDCIISIEDKGIGMTFEQLDNLFKIGNFKKNTGTENETGWGLGLIFVKELIKKNNGKIWAESKENEGTKIIFTLPVK